LGTLYWNNAPIHHRQQQALEQKRRSYVFKDIRQFCREGTEELVCHQPHTAELEEIPGEPDTERVQFDPVPSCANIDLRNSDNKAVHGFSSNLFYILINNLMQVTKGLKKNVCHI